MKKKDVLKRSLVRNLQVGEEARLKGWVYRLKKLKQIAFVYLRDRSGVVQCVVEDPVLLEGLSNEAVVQIEGRVQAGKNKYHDFELLVKSIQILNPARDLPFEVNQDELKVNLDTMLDHRPFSLRHKAIEEIFSFQNEILRLFREYMVKEDFFEIRTPKIVSGGAEGGTEVFRLDYFGKDAFLTQSPQFFKEELVAAGLERVFEVGPVYRAEEHSTRRHLNEYISLDFEMGFIEDFTEIMDEEEALLRYLVEGLEKSPKVTQAQKRLLPTMVKIPRLHFKEALDILKQRGYAVEGDLDPKAEAMLCRYSQETYQSDFIFITHYPKKKRPMYTMPHGTDETLSFDLLFREMEITTGGQRIHNYEDLVAGFKRKGLQPEDFASHLDNYYLGMPPHGGLAIGLERLTAMFLKLANVRQASFYPRDKQRLMP